MESAGFFRGFEDCHSHILPGVDDGVGTEEEALEIVKQYERLGVRRVWFTPHIMEDIPNTTASLRARFETFCRHCDTSIDLRLSAENMLDGLFEERLAADDVLPYGFDGDRLLVETSYFTPPYDFYGMLERVKHKGYYPVLAHPERYIYMDEKDYIRLKTSGIMFQLNVPSLVGFYGPDVRRKAEWLLRKGYYNVCGCDIHSLSAIKYMESARFSYSSLRLNNLLSRISR